LREGSSRKKTSKSRTVRKIIPLRNEKKNQRSPCWEKGRDKLLLGRGQPVHAVGHVAWPWSKKSWGAGESDKILCERLGLGEGVASLTGAFLGRSSSNQRKKKTENLLYGRRGGGLGAGSGSKEGNIARRKNEVFFLRVAFHRMGVGQLVFQGGTILLKAGDQNCSQSDRAPHPDKN